MKYFLHKDEWKSDFLHCYLSEGYKSAITKYHQYMPNSIYKYRPGNAHDTSAIIDGKLWLSNALVQNDPFECALMFMEKQNGTNEITENKEKAYEEYKAMKQRERVSQDFQEHYYISAFSEVWDSLLMWTNYAQNHMGFCIEYDFAECISGLQEGDYLLPALYSNEIIDCCNWATDEKIALLATMKKTIDWSYEHEWRLVSRRNESQNENIRGYLLDFPKPRRIYIGYNFGNVLGRDYSIEKKKSLHFYFDELRTFCIGNNIHFSMVEISTTSYALKSVTVK